MGEFKYGTAVISTLDYCSSLFANNPVATSSKPNSTAMQDDLLIEKQTTNKPAPLSPGGSETSIVGSVSVTGSVGSLQEKSKTVQDQESEREVGSISSIGMSSIASMTSMPPMTVSTSDKDGAQPSSFPDPVRVPSLWADDGSLHNLPVNGSLGGFQNFPTGGPAGLFANTGSGAGNQSRRAITASHNFPGGNQSSGGASGGSAGVGGGGTSGVGVVSRHGVLSVSSPPQQQTQQSQTQQSQAQQQHQQTAVSNHPGVYVQGKGYAAWSGGSQSGVGPQQWGGGGGGGGGPQGGGNTALQSPWSRGRSVPNLPPLHSSLHVAAAAAAAAASLQGRKPSPTFPGHPVHQGHGGHPGHPHPGHPGHQGPTGISPVKFRRSTSYPGKTNLYPPPTAPTFEVTGADERDLMQLPPYQQVGAFYHVVLLDYF